MLPTVVATFALIGLVPRTDVDAQTPAVRGADETQCLPTGPLDSVDALNRFAQTVRGGSQFLGGDVGTDVLLQDGRRLWVFGDTLRSDDFSGQHFVRNSALVFTAHCAQVVLPADHGALIPDRADGVGYWPMSIAKVRYTGYDLIGVAAQRVHKTGNGTFDFQNLGPAMAIFIVPRGKAPQLILERDIGKDDPSTTRPTWGASMASYGGWVYLYGTARPKTGSFGYSLRVARLRPNDFLDQSRWRYWDGKSWQPNASRAKVLIPAVGGVSQTLSVFTKNGRWYALSKRDEFLGNDLVVWTAPGPAGPFTAAVTLAEIPSDIATGELRYMPLAHPDLLPEPTSIIVSYSRNNTDIGKVKNDPFLYRPSFLRVTLP